MKVHICPVGRRMRKGPYSLCSACTDEVAVDLDVSEEFFNEYNRTVDEEDKKYESSNK